MGDAVLVVLGVAGVLWLLVSGWLDGAKAPATDLACRNCPRLARQIRLWQLLAAVAAAVAVLAFAWALAR